MSILIIDISLSENLQKIQRTNARKRKKVVDNQTFMIEMYVNYPYENPNGSNGGYIYTIHCGLNGYG